MTKIIRIIIKMITKKMIIIEKSNTTLTYANHSLTKKEYFHFNFLE